MKILVIIFKNKFQSAERKEFLSYEGIKECYKDLQERDLINEDYFVKEIEIVV